ncbi:osteopetrosis-associated transmembrane protein 1 isoform X2 [Aethina tumida]|nr:osteopetrosis-associated transmembrane protein 1 isoform X2 [Aethina tumida]
MEVITTYKEMANLKINDTSCLDYFTNQDRLGIVNSLYEDAKNLWNKAKCYECFNFENGEMTNNLSSQTVKFLTYYNETMNCINTTGLQSNITSVCNNCMQKYITLDEYYQSISNENEQIGVCMDIVDLMNNTRKYWSENCCKFRKHDETIFLVSAGGVLFLTVMFYAITHWCAERKIPTILQQPRFVESLNNMTT